MQGNILKKYIYTLFDKLLNFIFLVSGLLILWLIWSLFFWTSFSVPSHSMEPGIQPGDRVVVWKPWMGARIFDIFASMAGKQPEIHRIPGLRSPQRGDVMVFNYPYANGLASISMHIKKYYIKRCLALPGDTIRITEGFYNVAGVKGILRNIQAQRKWAKVPEKELRQRHLWETYPKDSLVNWNVKTFGPLFVPAIGSEIQMNPVNYLLYQTLIEWESHKSLHYNTNDSCYYLGDKQLSSYHFHHNYYFMAGDYVESSEDSRYWGLVPEPFIVGKVAFISQSHDPQTRKFRWDRWLKKVE